MIWLLSKAVVISIHSLARRLTSLGLFIAIGLISISIHSLARRLTAIFNNYIIYFSIIIVIFHIILSLIYLKDHFLLIDKRK